jgi:hypothetical protein
VPPPAKGDRLPAADHILRYIRKKHVDRDTDTVNGSGFLTRPDEDAPSSNWIECFDDPIANQLAEIKSRKRYRYEKRGKLVRLSVTATERHIRENRTADAAAIEILLVHDPLEADGLFPPDPSHSLANGVPQIGGNPEAELIGDLFLDCVLETFDVSAD